MKWWRIFGEMFLFEQRYGDSIFERGMNNVYLETLTVMMIPCHWDWECERQPPYVNDNEA